MIVAPVPPISERPPGRWLAILIGINQYRNGLPPLRNAVHDVQTIAQLLRDEHAYEVRLVIDEAASLSGLRALFSGLPAELTADTHLVIYFAGHGIADDAEAGDAKPQGFLIPQDAQLDRRETYLPMTDVQELLSKLPCNHLLLFLDCCFAGAFRWSTTRSVRMRPAPLYQERFQRYLRDPAWQVISSTAADERALDAVTGGKLGPRGSDGENSPFARALHKALRGAADMRIDGQQGNGVMIATELHLYLMEELARPQPQQPMTQSPLLWSIEGRDKGQFVFFLPGRRIKLPRAEELNEKNNPYRGLEPYDEKHSSLYCGRSEVVELLFKRVAAQPLTVVSGASGSGKTSLLLAGLLPYVRAKQDWEILPIVRPGSRPLAALSPVLMALAAEGASKLNAAVADWRARSPDKSLLLVIDQLEELTSAGAASSEQKEFLADIQQALAVSEGRLHVVIALRASCEPLFPELLAKTAAIDPRFPLPAMERAELRQVIEEPAAERVLYFEPASLVESLINDVANGVANGVAKLSGALPLLSLAMSELYRAYVRSGLSDRCLTTELYTSLGGISGLLCRHADEIVAGFDDAQRGTLWRLMLRMVSLQAGEVAPRPVRLEELQYGSGHPESERIKTVLERMQEARLLVTGRDGEGEPFVEPAHTALLRDWSQLRSIIQKEQETLSLQRLLYQEAVTWARNQRSNEHLWAANPRLPLALALRTQQPERWNALEDEFIAKSQRQLSRKRNLVRALVTAVIVILSGLTVVAIHQRNQALAQRREAIRQSQLAEAQRRRAQERFEQALEVIERIMRISDLKLRPIAGAAKARSELLELCSEQLRRLEPATHDDERTQRLQVAGLLQQADLRLQNGKGRQLDGAWQLYMQARQIAETLLRKRPADSFAKAALARCYERSGIVELQRGRVNEVKELHQKALALRKELTAAEPTNPTWLLDESTSDLLLGLTYERGGSAELPLARSHYEHALLLRQQLVSLHAGIPDYKMALSEVYLRLGRLLLLQIDDLQESVRNLELSRTLQEELVHLDAANSEWQDALAEVYDTLGQALRKDRERLYAETEFDKIVQYHQRALAIRKRLLELDPTSTTWQLKQTLSHNALGSLMEERGLQAEAKQHYEQALLLRKRLAASDPGNAGWRLDLLQSYQRYLGVLRKEAQREEYLKNLQEAQDILGRLEKEGSFASDEQLRGIRGYLKAHPVQPR